MIMRSSIKKGKDIVVEDTISRKYEDEGSLFSLSSLAPKWLEEAHQKWKAHDSTAHLIKRLQEDTNHPQGYTWQKDTLKHKGRLLLVPNSALKERVLTTLHSSPLVGHSGF